MLGTKSEIRSTEKWEKGKKGGREEGRKGGREEGRSVIHGEKLLVAHDCGFVGSEGFHLGISNLFEISNFGFRIS